VCSKCWFKNIMKISWCDLLGCKASWAWRYITMSEKLWYRPTNPHGITTQTPTSRSLLPPQISHYNKQHLRSWGVSNRVKWNGCRSYKFPINKLHKTLKTHTVKFGFYGCVAEKANAIPSKYYSFKRHITHLFS
jgi:hypothetical protein